MCLRRGRLRGTSQQSISLDLCRFFQQQPRDLLPAHPLVPLLQVSADPATTARFGADLDLELDVAAKPAEALAEELMVLIQRAAGGKYIPIMFSRHHIGFQMTRGKLGFSM